ncbi:MAG: HigA family addiction module antidote protein [Candidatus Riflebacteria bacterium]|nr:HigA family addiction module antidote protein [Candidatus Riflebacteria bacterium]
MSNEEFYAYKPDYAIHPGEYLEEVLKSNEIKKKDLSDRLGISVKHLSQIIHKQEMITAKLAVQLERTLGISGNIWNNLNADYSLFCARSNELKALKFTLEWINDFPINELKKIGFLPSVKDKETIAEKLLQFFGVSTPEQWQQYYDLKAAYFRKSPAFSDNLSHIASWLRIGEIKASEIAVAHFDKDVFKTNLDKIRSFTLNKVDEFEPEMKRLCAMSGVILVFVPEFKKTHISGVARWLTQEKAMIIMSLRYKTNDHFWFTFFHEAAHILLHGKKNTFIDDLKGFPSKEEDEANRYSKNMLIPESEYKNFVSKGRFSHADIKSFSKKIKIHPGILVGRLQHDKHIKYGWHNDLKEKYEFILESEPSLTRGNTE